MTDRIEEAAKAMHAGVPGTIDQLGFELAWDELSEPHRGDYLRLAIIADPILRADLSAEVQRLRGEREGLVDALTDMVNQFAYPPSGHPEYVCDGGLSALENAIPTLVSVGKLRRVEGRPDKDWYEWAPTPEAG